MATPQALKNLDSHVSFRAFGQGMAVVVVLFILLVLWLWLLPEAENETVTEPVATGSTVIPVNWPPSAVREKTNLTPDGEASAETRPAPSLPNLPGLADLPRLESGLVKAPIEGFYEQTATGLLPTPRADDMLTPFEIYRRFVDIADTGRPSISLVLEDAGLSNVATEAAIRDLPPDITFALSPYTEDPSFWVRESRVRGHEIWLTLPMETEDYPRDDPGPHTLLIKVPQQENERKLNWVLGRTSGYVGVIGPHGSRFTNSLGDMRPILGAIYRRGLGFVNTSPEPVEAAESVAAGFNAPYGQVDVWLDRPASPEAIRAALTKLEQTAFTQGHAVGVFRSLPASYDEIREWVNELPAKDLNLVPLSYAITK